MGSVVVIVIIASVLVSVGVAVVVLRAAGIGGPRKKVLATGKPGRATIVGLAPTGTVINEINYVVRFQLRVQLPGQAPYDVETKETVPITSMAMLVPGTVVAVRVDQVKPELVFIDWQQGVTPAAGAAVATGAVPSAAEVAQALHDPSALASVPQGSAADLLRTGQPAQGYLKSFSDTGQTLRSAGRTQPVENLDDPLFVLTVELHFGAGMAPVEGTVIHRVPRAIAPTLRLGLPLTCAVDPGNPTRAFAVNWAALAAPAAAPAPPWGTSS
jgi:hypothetical protein